MELSGQADGGSEEGTYVELGVGPSWPLGGKGVTIGIPVKLGLSLQDYYEADGEDNKFGYFDIGALFTVPFAARRRSSEHGTFTAASISSPSATARSRST